MNDDGLHIAEQAPPVLSSLGLRAGDTLVSINGFDLTTPDGALEVSLRRSGAPTVLHVRGAVTVP